jgi:two-component system response regulator PilR (NtrC family)
VVCDILSASHTCRAVRTAEEGLELLAGEAFDVAITDVKLPGMGGEEFLRRAHELIPSLPVVVIAGGYGFDENRFRDAGAFGCLLKPSIFEKREELVGRALAPAGDT